MGAKRICIVVFEPSLATKSVHLAKTRDCGGSPINLDDMDNVLNFATSTWSDVLVSLVLRIVKVSKRQHATSRKK